MRREIRITMTVGEYTTMLDALGNAARQVKDITRATEAIMDDMLIVSKMLTEAKREVQR